MKVLKTILLILLAATIGATLAYVLTVYIPQTDSYENFIRDYCNEHPEEKECRSLQNSSAQTEKPTTSNATNETASNPQTKPQNSSQDGDSTYAKHTQNTQKSEEQPSKTTTQSPLDGNAAPTIPTDPPIGIDNGILDSDNLNDEAGKTVGTIG